MRLPHVSGARLLPGRLVLAIYALVLAFPLLWMIVSSFKPTLEVYGRPWSLPSTWRFDNYSKAWELGVSQYFLNSLLVTAITTVAVLAVAEPVRPILRSGGSAESPSVEAGTRKQEMPPSA